jgi:hypothetical protein
LTDPQTKASPTASGINFEIYSDAGGAPVSTGTLVQVTYDIEEFQGGVSISDRTGVLMSGDPFITESYTSGAASYTVRLEYYYDDGASFVCVKPYELTGGGNVNTLTYDQPELFLNCRDADLKVPNLAVGAFRSSNETWLNGDLITIDTGNTFMGDIPEVSLMNGINLVYSIGLDVTEWTDFDPTFNAYEIGAIGWTMPNCV